jgi:hypothetical protein
MGPATTSERVCGLRRRLHNGGGTLVVTDQLPFNGQCTKERRGSQRQSLPPFAGQFVNGLSQGCHFVGSCGSSKVSAHCHVHTAAFRNSSTRRPATRPCIVWQERTRKGGE